MRLYYPVSFRIPIRTKATTIGNHGGIICQEAEECIEQIHKFDNSDEDDERRAKKGIEARRQW